MTERFANNAATVLSLPVALSDTTITVLQPGAFPNSGNFRILIESEYLLVTAVNGSVFIVTRGIEGSTASAHPAFVSVTHIVTAGSLAQFITDLNGFSVTDPRFAGGAVGDFVHDDTAAILAAQAAAKAANGVLFFPTPPVAYKITSEIPIDWGTAQWKGQASGNPFGPTIRAASPMRACVSVRTTFDLTQPNRENEAVARGLFENLTFDANFLAKNAVIEVGSQFSVYKNICVRNALESGVRSALMQTPVTIGTITQTGGGASITVTQADPNYFLIALLASPGGTIVLKVTGAGTTYAVSFDGGVTYQAGDQAIRLNKQTNIVQTDGLGHVITISGLQVTWGASVVNGTTYAVPITYVSGDVPPNFVAGNSNCSYYDFNYNQCGSVYHTLGMGAYNFYNTTQVAGSISLTGGSQVVQGTSTVFQSMAGAGYSRIVLQTSDGQVLQGVVVDDVTIATVIGGEPAANAANKDFAIATLGGRYEDGWTDGLVARHYNGSIANCSTGMQLAGAHGSTIMSMASEVTAIVGLSVGGPTGNSPRGVLIANWVSASNSNQTLIISPTSSGTIIEPLVQIQAFGNTSGWMLSTQGNLSPLVPRSATSYVPISSLHLNSCTQNITAAGQSINLPDEIYLGNLGHTSLVLLNPNNNYRLNGAPTIPAPPGNISGLYLIIINVSSFAVEFQDQSTIVASNLILTSPSVTLGAKESIVFVSTSGGLWVQQGPATSLFGGTSANPIGNTGEGRRRVVTTNNTPTEIWRWNANNASISPGSILKFDIIAQSNGGQNVGMWLNNVLGYSLPTGNRFHFALASGNGTGAGDTPPNSWAISVDPSGTSPFPRIYVAGDNTANPVTWIIVMTHRDPGQ